MKNKMSLFSRIKASLIYIRYGKSIVAERCEFCNGMMIDFKPLDKSVYELKDNQYMARYVCKRCGAVGIATESWFTDDEYNNFNTK